MKNRFQYSAVLFLVALITWTATVVPAFSHAGKQPAVAYSSPQKSELRQQKAASQVLSDQTAQLTIKTECESAPSIQWISDYTVQPEVPDGTSELRYKQSKPQTKTRSYQQRIRALLYPHHSFS